MRDHHRSTTVGVFDTPESAREAVEALRAAGFEGGDVGMLVKDRNDSVQMIRSTESEAGTGAATGLVGGGILGGLAGWLVGVGALAIPGVGPFIAAGAFGTAIAGAAIGAGVGAVAGTLAGMGIPKEEAEWYEGEVRGGRTLVSVRPEERFDEARRILHDYGAYDVHDRGIGVTEATATPEDLDSYNAQRIVDEEKVVTRDFDETRTYHRPIDEPSTPQMGDDQGATGTPRTDRDVLGGHDTMTEEERRRHAA